MLLYQPQNGYCYNSDSIFLYDFISSLNPRGKILDIGCGSGIIGLLLARDFKNIDLEAVEKQDDFVEYAKINAKINKIKGFKIYKNDFLNLNLETKYDYIISNPPFYNKGTTKSKNNMISTARDNENLPIENFFKKVSQLLKPKAHFVFCYDASQFALICAELQKVKLRVVSVRFVHPKIDRDASLVMIYARNSSKSMMKVLKPLIAFSGKDFSQEAIDIYAKASTKSIKCCL